MALKWWAYGGGLISATTGHAASRGLEQRRHGRARQANSLGAAGTASPGALLYEPRRRGAHLANHRVGQRGVSSVCGQDTSALAKPATLLRRRRAANAAHHGRSRAPAPCAQTWWRCTEGGAGRDSLGNRDAGGGIARAG